MPDFQQYFDESHQLIRDSVRRFVEREVASSSPRWSVTVPSNLWKPRPDRRLAHATRRHSR